ncbi:MAG: hypothetical protein ACRCYO_01970, partial [Bacteroidia bacterium]
VSMMWRFKLILFFLCAWPFCGGAQVDLFWLREATWNTYLASITTAKTVNNLYGFDAKFVQQHKIASVAKKIESMSSDGEDGASEPDRWNLFQFDRSGRVISAKYFLHDTIHPIYTSSYAYDRFGNLTTTTDISFSFKESKNVKVYEYNNIGKLKREQTFLDDKPEANITREFLYNTKQELIVERFFYEKNLTTITYEYDDYGRIVKRQFLGKDNVIQRMDSIVFMKEDTLIDNRKAQHIFYYERQGTTGSFFRRTEEFVDVETGLSIVQTDSISERENLRITAHLEQYKRSFDPIKAQYEYAKTWERNYEFSRNHLHASGMVDRAETMTFEISNKGEKKPIGRVEISSLEDSKTMLLSERTRKSFIFQNRASGNTAFVRFSQIETFYWSFYP